MEDESEPPQLDTTNKYIQKLLGLPDSLKENPIFSLNFYNNFRSLNYFPRFQKKLNRLASSLLKEAEDNLVEPSEGSIFLEPPQDDKNNRTSIINTSHFFKDFIVDRTGLCVKNGKVDNIIQESIRYQIDGTNPLSMTNFKGKQVKRCFNCNSDNHALKDCPLPKNQENIYKQRREFTSSFQNTSNLQYSRYHDQSTTLKKFQPGSISDRLRNALGINQCELPPYIYKMRQIGYPPGYLHKHSDSNLTVVGERPAHDSSINDSSYQACFEDYYIYPGFNAPVPDGIVDRAKQIGFPLIDSRNFVPVKPDSIMEETTMTILADSIITIQENQADPSITFRPYFYDPLPINIFAPKRTWRHPPIILDSLCLETSPSPVLDFKISPGNIFFEQELPTNRLHNIVTYLRKNLHEASQSFTNENKIDSHSIDIC